MKRRGAVIAAAGAAVAAALLWASAGGDAAAPPQAQAAAAASGAAFPPPWSALPAQASGAGLAPAAAAADSDPLDTLAPPRFRTDRQGNLLADAQARHGIERLSALGTQDEALATVREAGLPPAAQRQLADLYHRYRQYAAALGQALPPGQAPADEQEALRQLDTLHRLRVEHFGAEAAGALFGEEEEQARRLVEMMRIQDDPGLTLEQKAERAQQEWARRAAREAAP